MAPTYAVPGLLLSVMGPFLSILGVSVGFSIATAAIPTSEFVSEKSKFNNMKSRSQCFWGKVLKKISTSADVTILPPNELISFTKDLQSDQYLLQIGWILPGMLIF